MKIGGGVPEHHAVQGLLAGSDEQPIALLLLDPEDLGVAEVVLGVAVGSEEQGLGILGPVLAVRAGGVHDALFASSAVARVVVTCIEQVVEPFPILHDGAGSQRGVGVGALAVVEHHAMVLVAGEVQGAVLVDRVVALAVVARIVEVVELERAVFGHEGHDIAHVAAIGSGIQVVLDSLVGLVGQPGGGRDGRLLGRSRVSLGGLGGGARAGGESQGEDQRQRDQELRFAHC